MLGSIGEGAYGAVGALGTMWPWRLMGMVSLSLAVDMATRAEMYVVHRTPEEEGGRGVQCP